MTKYPSGGEFIKAINAAFQAERNQAESRHPEIWSGTAQHMLDQAFAVARAEGQRQCERFNLRQIVNLAIERRSEAMDALAKTPRDSHAAGCHVGEADAWRDIQEWAEARLT